MSEIKTGYGARIKSSATLKNGEFDFNKLNDVEADFWPELMLSHQHYETGISVSGDIRNNFLIFVEQTVKEIKDHRSQKTTELNSLAQAVSDDINSFEKTKIQSIVEKLTDLLPKEGQIKDLNLKGAVPQITGINREDFEFQPVDTSEPDYGSFEMTYMSKIYDKVQEEIININEITEETNGESNNSKEN